MRDLLGNQLAREPKGLELERLEGGRAWAAAVGAHDTYDTCVGAAILHWCHQRHANEAAHGTFRDRRPLMGHVVAPRIKHSQRLPSLPHSTEERRVMGEKLRITKGDHPMVMRTFIHYACTPTNPS